MDKQSTKQPARKPWKTALWIGVLLPVLPLAFNVWMGHGGNPLSIEDWTEIIRLYLIFTFIEFLVALGILKWLAIARRSQVSVLDLFLELPRKPVHGFSEEPPVPAGHAVVYFYRLRRELLIADSPILYVEDERLTSLAAGAYYRFLTDPGEKEFRLSNSSSSICLNFVGDQLCFVKIEPEGMHFVALQVSTEEGLEETWKDIAIILFGFVVNEFRRFSNDYDIYIRVQQDSNLRPTA